MPFIFNLPINYEAFDLQIYSTIYNLILFYLSKIGNYNNVFENENIKKNNYFNLEIDFLSENHDKIDEEDEDANTINKISKLLLSNNPIGIIK